MDKTRSDTPQVFTDNGEDVNQALTASDALNPYQPQDLWIDPAAIQSAGATKKHITTIPLRKPNRHEFFRVHGAEEYWKPAAFIELAKGDLYLVHPRLVAHLDPADLFYAYLCLAISKSGVLFLWPLKLSKSERENLWNKSALEVARLAVETWVKIRSRQEDGKGGGFYEAEEPLTAFGEPAWPELTPKQVYDIAFKGERIIARMDHLAIQKLTGQIQ